MARKRMIDPNIWASEDFSKLSTLAKLVFIGMFSNADDEGRGRAKPAYLKSIIFPYDDGIRIIDIDKTLSEIGSNMSVTFYSNNGNDYYALDNWLKWQKVDRPTLSTIPALDENSTIIRRTLDECSTNARRTFAPNIIEQNRIEKNISEEGASTRTHKFSIPTVEEIKEYCTANGYSINADSFYDFYESKGWKVGSNSMKDWKAAVRNWARRDKSKPTSAYVNPTQMQNEYGDLERFYTNKD